jgi:hypothetical protein
VTEGKVNSLDDAIQGKWEEKEKPTLIRWVFDGRRVRYELTEFRDGHRQDDIRIGDDERAIVYLNVAPPGEPHYEVTIRSVSDGGVGPRFTPLGHAMNGDDDSLHLGHVVGAFLDRYPKLRVEHEGIQETNGTRCHVLLCTDTSSGQFEYKWRYWVDPERGFLPIRYDSYEIEEEGKLHWTLRLTQIKEYSRRRFVATRSVWFVVPPTPDRKPHCREVLVTNLDIDHRPVPTEFVLSVPLGTPINNGITGVRYVPSTKEYAQLDISNLPEVTHAMAERMRATKPGGRGVSYLIAVNLGVLLAVVAYLILRHRRRNMRTS